MAFNTLMFVSFFLIVLIGYYAVPKRFKWVFLLFASYFFYLYASLKFAFFILITTISSYYAAIWIGKMHEKENNIPKEIDSKVRKAQKQSYKKKRKRILVLLLVLNFGILLFLKYFNFASDNLNALFGLLDLNIKSPTLNLILPLGISFYTFQTMSYVIDVYWGKVEAEKNFGKVALFVSFFPQIIEGPIGRYKDLAPQLYQERGCNYRDLKFGIQLMAWGYIKKMVIADRVAIIADYVFANYLNVSGFGVAFGVFMYAIQDYTDFSGAIDIARGCAKAMGIDMAENFRRPYFSKTVPEFWRRWHMSLGAWMKDYVFYPFSLSKGMRNLSKFAKKHFGKHIGRTLPIAIGNFLVFFLVGVWHGANWNYIVWGIFYGTLIAVSGMLKPIYDWLNKTLRIKTESSFFHLFQILRTFWITCIGCIIFRADGLIEAWQMFLKSFRFIDFPNGIRHELLSFGLDKSNYVLLLVALIVLFIIDVLQEKGSVRERIESKKIYIRWALYMAAFLAIILFGIYGPGYSQSQFVYMQF